MKTGGCRELPVKKAGTCPVPPGILKAMRQGNFGNIRVIAVEIHAIALVR